MHAVLLDFNGTMFFDTRFHMEAWSKIYHELHPEDKSPLASTKICGPCNDVILKNMAPWLTPAERQQYSEKKEALYREACRNDPASLHLVAGAEELLQGLQKRGIPFALASASIKANVDFYFDSFPIGHWLKQQDVVYDDGSYADKGEMHLEAARRLGVPFSECLVIEDSVTAIALAKRNGAGRIVGVGETADGSRHIYVKGTRWSVTCTLGRMSSAEMKSFLGSISGVVVTVEFRNPETEAAETITATISTPVTTYLRLINSGRVLFDELPLTFTEV